MVMNTLPKQFSILTLALLLLALLIVPTAEAADIQLIDACSLADAIKAANTDEATGGCPAGGGADTITLLADITLDAALPHITSDITLEGNDRTISGNNRFHIFAVNGGSLTVNDLTLTKCKADWGGAIVNVNGGTLTINDSTITDSIAQEGGAIGGDSRVTLSNSALLRNSADVGGAIHTIGGKVEISGGLIAQNTSEKGAGAIYGNEATLHISSVIFSDNEADGAGGVMFTYDGTTTVTGSRFLDNISGGSGGAISVSKGKIRLVDSVVEHNSSEWGGGISSDSSELEIVASQILHNVAERAGGGIHSSWGGKLTISNSIIGHNESRTGGRASSGGGIYSSSRLKIIYSLISNNAADEGAGIISKQYSEVSNTGITGNSALESGGGLYVEDKTAILSNVTVASNIARQGGGLYVEGESAKLSNVTMVSNTAQEGSGLYRETGADIDLRNSILAANKGGDCFGRLSENVSTLIADGSCFATLSGDPMLGELVKPEDGSPAYFPLLEGSPAIDAADDEYCPDTDITGTLRPQGAACDIGAYELPQ